MVYHCFTKEKLASSFEEFTLSEELIGKNIHESTDPSGDCGPVKKVIADHHSKYGRYPLVNFHITMENHQNSWENSL